MNLNIHRVVKVEIENRILPASDKRDKISYIKELMVTDSEGNTYEITLFSDDNLSIEVSQKYY
jgi:hypothetical protein